MALGKYARVDGKKSAGYCSTVTIVVFVALCLVGVWMMTSSSVVPVQNFNNDGSAKEQVGDSYSKSSGSDNSSYSANTNETENYKKPFDDSEGDLPDDPTKGGDGTEEPKNTVIDEKKKPIEDEENSGVSKPKDNEGDKKDDAKSKEDRARDGEKKEGSGEKKDQDSPVYPSGAQTDLLNETTTQNGSFTSQVEKSEKEEGSQSPGKVAQTSTNWKVCNTSAGTDYIPCLDNLEAIRHLESTKHYEHRERHCPKDPPTCLVPLPEGYQQSIQWPTSREKIYYNNVPHKKLAKYKGHQNWVKVSGEYLIFPGGGTQFLHGANHYIDIIKEAVPDIAWGNRTRVVLDVGCGVASFGGFLFDRDVLTMSLAPKDEHEAQIQFALERGIPAISAVMGTKRLPYPGRVFDIVHCARCRVPWHIEGGKLLLELNRLLRPGGFFVWSATPVYRTDKENAEIMEAMKSLTKSMCWENVNTTKDVVDEVGIAIYRKPISNKCYEQRPKNDPPLCKESDDPNAAWNVPLQACLHKIPVGASERGSQWPETWPARVETPPYWLLSTQTGVYGKPAPEDFTVDYKHWKRVVDNSYLKSIGINWSTVRNVMDMNAIYGGFAAALRQMNLWVMNIVLVDSPDTLPIIYERGLFGMYHDWCESFSTYPRSYDLLHADHLFSKIKAKCNYKAFIAEVDRILRPGGKIIIRDKVEIINEMETMFKAMQWEIRMTYSKGKEGMLCAQKAKWRPNESEAVTYALP